jgi:hypothetical protein
MTSGQAKNSLIKPKILWIADEKHWAYGAIYQHQSKRLSDYTHAVFYMMRKDNEWHDWVRLGYMIGRADIVVCMHLMYFVQIKEIAGSKAVIMLTGPRIFE